MTANEHHATSLHAKHHDEVLRALKAIGNPQRGEAIRLDRGSQLQHLGIAFPALRARVKQGFSFSTRPAPDVLQIWAALWHASPCGDVLFAALEYLSPIVRKQVPAGLWPVVGSWSGRIDNWCHSDALSAVYSRVLQAQFDEVYPQLLAWNAAPSEWLRRLSITSLIHYSGKNAIFLEPGLMLPLLAPCVPERRKYVELALGWVLREMGQAGPRHVQAADGFLQAHAKTLGSRAWARALERRPGDTKSMLLALRA